MKRITKLTFVGFVGGLGFGILTSIRYFIMYPDMDKALVYGLVAVLILGLSWCHEEIVRLRNTTNNVEEYLADVPWRGE